MEDVLYVCYLFHSFYDMKKVRLVDIIPEKIFLPQ